MSAVWPRPHWQAGDGRSLLLWFVFGDFPRQLPIDGAAWRTRGLPTGAEIGRYGRHELERWPGYPLTGALGDLLREDDPALAAHAAGAPEGFVIRAELADAPDLDALRDGIGLVSALMATGGVAAVDPQLLTAFDAVAWRARFFARPHFDVRDHVLMLCDADAQVPGRLHVHTRGLRKFARPDLSLRRVPAAARDTAGELLQRLAEWQALGGRFDAGQTVQAGELALTAVPGGRLDDPAFNNLHVAFDWP
ncbi:MAG TPA: hypothetical protein VND63_04280 [Rhodanobacteraceae bacterium]|nr:hypothetical protein [Rhodanobacteraceae bacterium]